MATAPTLRPGTLYKHVQDSNATTWVIDHGMNTYPVVDVYVEVGGQVLKVLPESVTYTNRNTVTITFSQPRSGFATVV